MCKKMSKNQIVFIIFCFQYGYIVKDLNNDSVQTMEIDSSDEEEDPESQNVSTDQPENSNPRNVSQDQPENPNPRNVSKDQPGNPNPQNVSRDQPENPNPQNISQDPPKNPNPAKSPSVSTSNISQHQRPVTSSAPLATSSSLTPTKSNTSPTKSPRIVPNISQHQKTVKSLAPPKTLTPHGPGPMMKPEISMTQTSGEGGLITITLPDGNGKPGLPIKVSLQLLENLVPGQWIPTCRPDHFLTKTAQGKYQIRKTVKTTEHRITGVPYI